MANGKGIPVIKFSFRQEWKVLIDALKNNPVYQTEEFSAASELANYLSAEKTGLVITSLAQKEDLIQVATLIKLQKKMARDAVSKVVVINFTGDKQFERAIAKLGILDIVDPSINTRALRFKIDFWMKALNAQLKKIEAVSGTQAVRSSGEPQGKAQEKKANEPAVKWVSPIECEDDIWLLKDGDCKKVLSKFLVKMMGPSPYTAQWNPVSGKSNIWKFEFKDVSKEDFVTGTGSWFFQGQRPEFIWKENLWLMTGESFELYYEDGSESLSKVKVQDKVLHVSRNSEFAKMKQELIVASFDKEMVFKMGAERLEDMEGETEGGADRFKNLEGEGKTDQLNGGPLSGKTKGTEDRSSGLLSHESGNQDLGGPLSSPASEGVREGQELGLEAKQNVEKYYKNHNEAEQYEGRGRDNYSGQVREREEGSGPNSGKDETDLINTYYNREGKVREKRDSENEQGDLDGKSSTDKLDGHYGRSERPERREGKERSSEDIEGRNPAEREKARTGRAEKAGSQGWNDDEAESLGGKSSTDRLKSHYGREEKDGHASAKQEREAQAAERDAREEKDKGHAKERERQDKGTRAQTESQKRDQSSPHSRDQQARRGREENGVQAESAFDKKDRDHKAAAEKESGPAGPFTEKEEKIRQERVSRAESQGRHTEKQVNEASERESAGETDDRAAAKKDRRSASESEGGAYGGKGQTDKMSAHYKQRERQEKTEAERKRNEESEDIYASKTKANGDSISGASAYDWDDDVGGKKRADREKSRSQNGRQGGDERAGSDKSNVIPFLREEKDPELSEASETAVVTSLLSQDSLTVPCVLDDHFEKTIIFTADDAGIAKLKNVKLDLNFKYLNKDTRLKFEGKVLEVDRDQDGKHYISVEISEENVSAFNSFMKLYEKRQRNVDYFLKRAKGL